MTPDGIKPNPAKIEFIQNMQAPKKVKQVQSILGFFNFYTGFARNYAEATLPLLELTRKGEKFNWTEEPENALNRMEKLFIDNVMLKYADHQKPFNKWLLGTI